ncbi:MAG: GNAT family N-acetyltransferase [Bacteroidota bacterium]
MSKFISPQFPCHTILRHLNSTMSKPVSANLPETLKTEAVPEDQSVARSVHYSLFRTVEAAGKDWDLAAPANDLFMQRRYLGILEQNPPEGMRFGYLVFYTGHDPIGVAIIQIKNFRGDANIQELNAADKETNFFDGISKWMKRGVAGFLTADILICGNLLLTGPHAFYFDPQKISHEQALLELEKSLKGAIKQLEQKPVKIPVILFKDIQPEDQTSAKTLKKKSFVEFQIQPNMVMPLPYRNFDAYLGAMSTKYRTRAKRAFKKAEGIRKHEMSLSDIQQELPRIYQLYKDIANNAGFNMLDLNKDYLLALKRDFADHYRMVGYYIDDKLVAFYTTIRNHHELEAHFLGYDKLMNHEYQLYLNILYDIIRTGIEGEASEIVFARTALEIKSSVGAVAHDLNCYVRYENRIINHLTRPLLEYLKPVEEWLPRHPFKE